MQFLCVEASNIMGAAVALAPGQEHTMTAVLSVAGLGQSVQYGVI